MKIMREDRFDVQTLLVYLIFLGVTIVFMSGCCVGRDEHRAFVEASRGFYDAVAAPASESIGRDRGLDEQSRKNRQGEIETYRLALEAAEQRARERGE